MALAAAVGYRAHGDRRALLYAQVKRPQRIDAGLAMGETRCSTLMRGAGDRETRWFRLWHRILLWPAVRRVVAVVLAELSILADHRLDDVELLPAAVLAQQIDLAGLVDARLHLARRGASSGSKALTVMLAGGAAAMTSRCCARPPPARCSAPGALDGGVLVAGAQVVQRPADRRERS